MGDTRDYTPDELLQQLNDEYAIVQKQRHWGQESRTSTLFRLLSDINQVAGAAVIPLIAGVATSRYASRKVKGTLASSAASTAGFVGGTSAIQGVISIFDSVLGVMPNILKSAALEDLMEYYAYKFGNYPADAHAVDFDARVASYNQLYAAIEADERVSIPLSYKLDWNNPLHENEFAKNTIAGLALGAAYFIHRAEQFAATDPHHSEFMKGQDTMTKIQQYADHLSYSWKTYRDAEYSPANEDFNHDPLYLDEWNRGVPNIAGRPMDHSKIGPDMGSSTPYPGGKWVPDTSTTLYDAYLHRMKQESIRLGEALNARDLTLQQARDDYAQTQTRYEQSILQAVHADDSHHGYTQVGDDEWVPDYLFPRER